MEFIINIVISAIIAGIVYVCLFQKPDFTPDKSRPTTGSELLFPGNPAKITSMSQLKKFTVDELAMYNGRQTEGEKLIYISIGGKVFDCTPGVQVYGPGGPYEMFAGRDISLAAAKFSKEDQYLDKPDLTGISSAEKDSFFHFYNLLYGKYHMVGLLEGVDYKQQLAENKAKELKTPAPYLGKGDKPQ
eukprot:UN02736